MPRRYSLFAIGVWLAVFAAPPPLFAQSYPPSEQPMYGGIEKTPAMREADRKYIETIEAQGVTRAQGAERISALGFQYFFRRDFATAMKRFNQAWLLDPKHASAYHGFALVLLERDNNMRDAEAMFKTAIALSSATSGAFADYGRYLLIQKRPDEAVTVLEQGLGINDSKSQNVRLQLANAYYDTGQYGKACELARSILGQFSVSDRGPLTFILESPHCKST